MDLFDLPPQNDGLVGSVVAHCAPPPPPPVPFIQEIHDNIHPCWPYWEGPKVSDDLDGRITVGECCAFDETTGEERYHYCAPCKVIEVNEEERYVRAVVDYLGDTHCRSHNGTILRLEARGVWVPVDQLHYVHDAWEHGFPTTWEPPAGFDSWLQALPERFHQVYQDAPKPPYAIRERSCMECRQTNMARDRRPDWMCQDCYWSDDRVKARKKAERARKRAEKKAAKAVAVSRTGN